MNTTLDIDTCIESFRRGDTDELATYLADDFAFAGPTPEPVPAAGFLGLVRLLFAAFPDLDWHLVVSDRTDDSFLVTTRTSGTHSGSLDLTPLGIGSFEPTGRSFQLPSQGFRWRYRDGLVTGIDAQPAEGVGIPAILDQLSLAVAAPTATPLRNG